MSFFVTSVTHLTSTSMLSTSDLRIYY